MAEDRDLEAEVLRLHADVLERVVAEYAHEVHTARPLALEELLSVDRPTLGGKVDVRYLRARALLGLRSIFGPRLCSRLLDEAGRHAARGLHLGSLDDLLAAAADLAINFSEVVEASEDRVVIEARECATCAGVGNIGQPVCCFEAGLIGGALECATGRPVTVRETKCWGLGDTLCRFEAQIGVAREKEPGPLEAVAALAARAGEASELLVKVREREAELERLARTDDLTGLANRRVLYERLAHEIERHKRYGRPVALLVADLDDFKLVNDTCGHQAGDRVLAAVGGILRAETRTVDVAARYGGEELAVVLGDTELAPAAVAAERLRCAVEALRVEGAPPLTVSIGAAAVPPVEADVDALMSAADGALYEAKRAGKNRVHVIE